MQERRNSIANALELRLSCTNPSICFTVPGGKKTSAGLSRSRVSLKDSLDLDDPYGSVSLEEVQTKYVSI